ncbi:MAG: hypothetical protein FWH38_03000, partial [Treponema sp.]|nr:hypothetical protein [Treponema sp.]
SGQNSNGYIPYNGDGFTGLRLGNISGSSPNNGNLLLMIGTALDAAKIGPKYTVTNASSTEAGTLDLSGPVRLTFEFAETAFTGYFRVYVNNNSTGAANSFLGNYSQYVHLPLADFRSAAALDDPAVPEGSGSYSCIIDYTEGNLLITPNNPAAVNLSPAQRNDLETAFIALHVQNNTGYINITSIKVENIAAASITVGREADFAGFPETLTLGSAESEIITLTGSGFSGADWYIDGIQKVTGTKTYTVTGLAAGEHSLTAIVTVNGKLYSKTVKFTVAE